MSGKIKELDLAENFQTETQTGVVLVDFFATWCRPCQMQVPILKEVAEKMGNKGKIIAGDIYIRKLALINKEAERLGITIVETKTWDATRLNSDLIESADRVLVDAPCSGLGVVRRKPEIKYKKKNLEIENLPEKQLNILRASSKYVKPGGILVYSTCTINPEENQGVVSEFLKENPMFIKEDMIQLMPNVNDTDGFFICKMSRTKE